MRDLYQAIGASPDDDARALAEYASEIDDADLCDDVYMVLLFDEERRAAYDCMHRRLHDIGVLRAELGLTESRQWPGRTARDFTPARKKNAVPRVHRVLWRIVRWLAIGAVSYSILSVARLLTGGV